MAEEEPSDELEKEIAELEQEIAALEEGEPVEQAPDTEPSEDVPDSKKQGLRDKLPFIGSDPDEPEDDEADEPDEADDEPSPDEEDAVDPDDDEGSGSGGISGFMSRFRGGDQEEGEEESAEEDAAPPPEDQAAEPVAEETEPPTPEPEAKEPTEEAPAPEPTEAETSSGALGGLMDRFSGEEDPQEPPEPADEPEPESEPARADAPPEPEPEPASAQPDLSPRRSESYTDRWEPTEEGWRRLDVSARDTEESGGFLSRFRGSSEPEPASAEEPVEDDEDEDVTAAAALLARFRSSEPDEKAEAAAPPPEPEEPEEEEEEEEDEGSKLVIAGWIIGILLLLALLAAAAAWLLGDDAIGDNGEDIDAALTSTAITNNDGAYIATVGSSISFDASGTTGTVTEYEWTFGDGTDATTTDATTTHTYTNRGPYTVSVVAVSDGTTSKATLDVLALEAPTPAPEILKNGTPVAGPGEVGNNVFVGESVTLDGEASSSDPETTLTTFEWDLDGTGGPEATGASAQASFDQAGRWLVNLTVVDDLGNEATATQPVHVADEIAFEDETVGAAVPEDTSNTHNVTVETGRLGVAPVQLAINLTYDPGGGDPVGEANSDLDLSATDPEGNTLTAEDDEATGQETLTVSGTDLENLGAWTMTVTHDQDGSTLGSGSEVTYTLVVETLY